MPSYENVFQVLQYWRQAPHVVEMQTQQASAPSFQAPVISPSSPPSTTSLRDLEVSVAKLYAIVNTQASATREMDTNNQN